MDDSLPLQDWAKPTRVRSAPIVSVAICTWNRARLLDQTLTRMGELIPANGAAWELLVVNNNCTDSTDDVVRRYANSLPIVLIHEPQAGKVHALNTAIARAAGEYILFTDDDALISPNWITEILAAFDRFGADMVFGPVEPWWETCPPPWFSKLFNGAFALIESHGEPRDELEPGLLPYGVNYAFRRSVFAELGPFDVKLAIGPKSGIGCGGEDEEIYLRLRNAGKKIVFAPAAVVRHYIPAARCGKAFHRRRAWAGSAVQLTQLRAMAAIEKSKTLFGIPRYFFRITFDHLLEYLTAVTDGDRSREFFFELKLRRFVGIMVCIWRGR